jgi:hypothetical protein
MRDETSSPTDLPHQPHLFHLPHLSPTMDDTGGLYKQADTHTSPLEADEENELSPSRSSLLGPFLEKLLDVFQTEVLPKLDVVVRRCRLN